MNQKLIIMLYFVGIIVLSASFFIMISGCENNDEKDIDKEIAEDFAIRHFQGRTFTSYTLEKTICIRKNEAYEVFVKSADTDVIESIVVHLGDGEIVRYEYDGIEYKIIPVDVILE